MCATLVWLRTCEICRPVPRGLPPSQEGGREGFLTKSLDFTLESEAREEWCVLGAEANIKEAGMYGFSPVYIDSV